MASVRSDITKYPKEYHKLFLKAALKVQADAIVITLESVKKAEALRRALYTFRRALFEQPELYPRVTLIAPCLGFNLEGSVLKVFNLDTTKELAEELLRKEREELDDGKEPSTDVGQMQIS